MYNNIKIIIYKIILIINILFFWKWIFYFYLIIFVFILFNVWWGLFNQWEGTTHTPIICSSIGKDDYPIDSFYKLTKQTIFNISYIYVSRGKNAILNKSTIINLIKILPYVLLGVSRLMVNIIISILKSNDLNINFILFDKMIHNDTRVLVLINKKWEFNPGGSNKLTSFRNKCGDYNIIAGKMKIITKSNDAMFQESMKEIDNALDKISKKN